MKKYVALALLSLQLFTPAKLLAQSEKDYSGTYLCISDAVGGVRFDEASKRWDSVGFFSGDRYILTIKASGMKKISPIGGLSMTYYVKWQKHGSQNDFNSKCFSRWDVLTKIDPYLTFINETFGCDLLFGDLYVNLKDLIYFKSSMVFGPIFASETPYVEVGACTKM